VVAVSGVRRRRHGVIAIAIASAALRSLTGCAVAPAAASTTGGGFSFSSGTSGGATSSGPSSGGAGSGASSTGSGSASSTGGAPTILRAFPQVPNLGGATIASPKLVLISYVDDPRSLADLSFATWLVASPWLSQVGAEYQVGTGTVAATVVLDAGPPLALDESQVGPLLDQLSQDAGWLPPPDGQTIYAVFLPSETVLSGPGGPVCGSVGAYHSSYQSGFWGRTVSYIVMPGCPAVRPPLDETQWREVYFSHELMETLTDADPTDPAFLLVDPGSDWFGELGDLCTGTFVELDAGFDSGVYAQRIWSNRLAADGGTFPCAPADDSFTALAPTAENPAAILVAAGGTLEIQLVGWFAADGGSAAVAWQPDGYSDGTLVASLQLSGGAVGAGQSMSATVSVPYGAQSGAHSRIELVAAAPDQEFFAWPILVTVP
jgi:hypothetical protein